jgi:fibronectin type 3 domain-containing protein
LSWQVPTTRADGSALLASDLKSYEIYYTTDTSATGTYVVNGGTTTSYSVTNLAAGTYYFAMSAIDNAGLKSSLSQVVTVKLGP